MEPESFASRLTAKAGPLPVWAWALIVVVGGFIAYRVLGARNSTSSPSSSAQSPDTATQAIDENSTPVGMETGYPPASGQGNAADNLSSDLYSQLGGLQGSVDMLTSLVQLSPAFWPGSDSGDTSNGTTPQAAQTPPKKSTVIASPKAGARAPASTKYYTYAPGKAPKGKTANQAPGKGPAGTTLRFQRGRGYYYA